MWILWIVLGWGAVVVAHKIAVHAMLLKHKKVDEEFLKRKAEELKTGKLYDFSKLAQSKNEFIEVTNQASDGIETKVPDIEDIEIADVVIKKSRRKRAKTTKKKTSKRGRPKKTTKKKTAKRKTAKKESAKKKATSRKKAATGRKPTKKKTSKRGRPKKTTKKK
ncbi:MAG: hypothetical protein GXO64_05020 [Candidatus Micrarchaeota archaeon]|nr:hypothetical protein [Candidatus Micrarchaeota archaeon]